MSGHPRVSCLCLTFNRPSHGEQFLVEEAIESFLRQDYADKELVIINDAPGQELFFAHPQVKIHNLSKRRPSLGDKYNCAVAMASGSLLCPWEDDDISLPWRLSQGVACLGERDYWKPPQVWFLPGPGAEPIWHHPVGVRHHASLFRWGAWLAAGMYPQVSGPQDTQFDARLCQGCRVAETPHLPVSEWAYLYRWGVSHCHLSGFPDTAQQYRNEGDRPIKSGAFALTPHWREDYVALTRACLPQPGQSG